MAKKWADVVGSEAFQALPDDAKEAAREQYFTSVIAPQVPENDVELARKQFFSSTSLMAPKRAAPQQAESEPAPAVTDPMGAMLPAAIAAAPEPKKSSVLEGMQMPAPLPTEDKMLRPEFVASVEAQLNSMPESKRQAALERMAKRPDVYGRAAKAIAGRYAALDEAAKTQVPTMKRLDPRLEAQTERFIEQGMEPEAAQNLAWAQAQEGGFRPDLQQARPDVEGEIAAQEAAAQQEKLKDAGFFGRVGAETQAQYEQAGLGLMNVFADLTGNTQLQRDISGARRMVAAGQQAIPKGTGVFERSAQGAISSLAGQAPMIALSMFTGTPAPVLLQAGVQQFGDSYGEARAAGQSPEAAAARAIPMAAAEVFFERFGMEKAMAGLRKFVADATAKGVKVTGNQIAEYIGKAVAKEIPSEMATTLTQYGIDIVPGVGLKKNPSVADLYNQLEETLRQTIIQSGVQAGTTLGAAKGLEKLAKSLEPERTPYQRDRSYEGRAALEALARGFMTLPRDERGVPIPPKPEAPTAEAPAPEAAAPAPETDREQKLAALAAEIESTGIPEEDARAQAEQTLAAQEAKEQQALAPRIIELTQEYVDGGMEPQAANQRAIEQAKEEAQADAQAQREGAVAAPAAERRAGRAGVGVAGQPSAVPPAGGAGVPQPSGVVPAGPNVAGSAVGAQAQPAAITPEKITELGNAITALPPRGWLSINKANSLKEALSNPATQQQAAQEIQTYLDKVEAAQVAAKPTSEQEKLDAWKTLANVQRNLAAAQKRFDKLDNERAADDPERVAALKRVNALQEAASKAGERAAALTPVVETPTTVPTTEAAPAPVTEAPKAKRGRPVVLTPEQKQQRAEAKKPTQAAKARAERSLARLTKTLDTLAEAPVEDDFETDEDYQAALDEHKSNRREAIKELLQLQADPTIRGTKVGERVKAALARPDITAKEKADLQAGIDAQKRAAAAAQTLGPSASRITKGKPDAAFNKFTNGVQALNHIIKTGTDFHKMLGKRLRGFVNNVRFVVIEEGQELPAQLKTAKNARHWERSIALYIENYKTGDRVIYVRGESFGADQGINNVTILHELLHAATNRKIALAITDIQRGAKDTPLIRAAQDLLRTMNSAIQTYNEMASAGKLSGEMVALARSGEALTDPREFIAYGMTDEGFQKFLMQARGYEEDTSFFNRFVRGIRELFGMDEDTTNALSDLIVVTDSILRSRAPTTQIAGEAVSPTTAEQPPEETEEVGRTQKELDRAVKVANFKFEESQNGQDYAKAVSVLQMMQDPRKAVPVIRDLYTRMNIGAREALVRLMTTDFLAEVASNSVPELKNTERLMQQMSGMTQTLLKAAGDLTNDISRAFHKNPDLRAKLDKITHVATLAEYDPADLITNKVRNKDLDQQYEALGDEGKRLYNRIKKHYETLSNYFSKLLDDQITQSGLPIAEQANLIKQIRAIYETGNKITPYFPLVRRGDYWLSIGTGDRRKFFMYETMGERDRAMRGFADEKVKQKPGESASAFEKRRAENLQELLESEDFVYGNDISSLRRTTIGNSQLLTGVFSEIDRVSTGVDFSPEAKEQLKDAIYQLYLQTMPEQSFRKQFLHRKGYAGFRTDLLRNVADTTTKMATQLARIKYAPLLRNSLSQARDSIKNRPTYEPFVASFERRVSDALSAGKASLAERIAGVSNRLSFIYYLGGVSSAVLQPLSLFQTGIPVLMKYGATNAYAEMGRMLKVWQEFGVMHKNADGSYSWVAPSTENIVRGDDERRAIKEMLGRDVTTSTYARDVMDYKAVPTEKIPSPKVQFAKDTVSVLVLGGLMHSSERLSREAMFLAAYRLNRKAGADHDTAVDNAVNDTNEALGNYGQYNRPEFMKGAPGKILTQFMMYPVHVTLFLGKNFVEMIKPMNGRTRWEATKKFMGTMGHTWVLAGAAGLWGFSTVMGLLGSMWNALKDDDWPEDVKSMSYELWWRTVWLKEQLGGTQIAGYDLADLVERGPVNAITGVDISSRVSLNNMWMRDTKETATVRESAMAMAMEKAGPTANMILAWAEAIEAFIQGDYKKGVLKAAPAGFRNWINAAIYYKEGAKDNKGAEILSRDAFTTGELIFQAVGFRSDLLANTQYVTFKVIGLEQKILNNRTLIMNQLDRAYRNKDFKAYTDYYEDMQKFNSKYPTYKITPENLVESLERKQEQRGKSYRGVVLTEKNIGPFSEALIPSRKAAEEREKKGRGQ